MSYSAGSAELTKVGASCDPQTSQEDVTEEEIDVNVMASSMRSHSADSAELANVQVKAPIRARVISEVWKPEVISE
eukprot:6975631-Heterocapsa_arctica.AAC.1